ncbi:MAG: TIGR02147 family protein [Fibrobacteria bacterium]|nr:TIGR02147 family protein [Fibrobacteria bacterium]
MRPIFEYLDYRDLLKDAFEERKEEDPGFCYRVMAEALGLHTSNVFRILNKETHLPARCQSRAVEFLGLTERRSKYFLLLVGYARERSGKARQEMLEKAMAMRDLNRMDLGAKELVYFRDWWIAAVRGVLEVVEGRTHPAEIAALLNPRISEEQVTAALELLLELGLVKKGSSGRLLVGEPHLGISQGQEKIQAVRQYQRQTLQLASEALERFPPEIRDVTTMSMAVDEAVFTQVRETLRECRLQIQRNSDGAKKPDRVMQLVMAYFPLTNTEKAS